MAANKHHGSITELQHNLRYQRQLFNTSKKQNACFEELKKIHLRIKEYDLQLKQLMLQRNLTS